MQRDALITLIAQQCGNVNLTNEIISNMDFVQSILLEQDPDLALWFLLTEDATASTVAEEPRVPVPTDFLIEDDSQLLEVLNPDTSKYVEVVKGDVDELTREFAEEVSGMPTRYALVGSYFRLFPTPDAAYTLRMRYMAKQALPSTGNIENAWMKHAADLLIAEVGTRVAGLHLKDLETAAVFKAGVAPAKTRLTKLKTAREEANTSRAMEGL